MHLVGTGIRREPGGVAVGIAHRFPQPGGLRRLDARPAKVLDQQAANEEGLVAQRLGVKPKPRAARQQPVGRVLGQALRASRASSGGRLPTSPGAS